MADFPRSLRLTLSKAKFALGNTPKIEKPRCKDPFWVPEGKQAVCLISADFEMAWAFHFMHPSRREDGLADRMGMRTRGNVPFILDLCDKTGVPITWATVGHLMLDECVPENSIKHPEIPRPPYYSNPYWNYDHGDWFDDDPCSNVKDAPAWYAPDLVRDIISRKVSHEIACHSFSHIDASDANCPADVFLAEMNRCIELAGYFNSKLVSFVHPGHQTGHLDILAEKDFSNFRTDTGNVLGPPKKHPTGLWEYRNTQELAWREGWSAGYILSRLKRIIDRAIKYHSLCVFWFHPSMDHRFVTKVFPGFLEYLDRQRNKIAIMTHSEYANFLDNSGEDI